jgi:hypothetical protein
MAESVGTRRRRRRTRAAVDDLFGAEPQSDVADGVHSPSGYFWLTTRRTSGGLRVVATWSDVRAWHYGLTRWWHQLERLSQLDILTIMVLMLALVFGWFVRLIVARQLIKKARPKDLPKIAGAISSWWKPQR